MSWFFLTLTPSPLGRAQGTQPTSSSALASPHSSRQLGFQKVISAGGSEQRSPGGGVHSVVAEGALVREETATGRREEGGEGGGGGH